MLTRTYDNSVSRVWKREDQSGHQVKLTWTVDETRELFEYMNGPLPDFEYKWPENYGGTSKPI